MSTEFLKLFAIALLVVGGLGLAYGGFNYTSETHTADIETLHLSVDEKQHINVSLWAGRGAIAAGLILFVRPGRG